MSPRRRPPVDEQEAFDVVRGYLVEQFDVPEDKIALEVNLFEDLELDSIDALDMVGLLESRLNMQVDEEQLRQIRTVGDVVDFVVRQAQAA
jgi:acyl carrier protein